MKYSTKQLLEAGGQEWKKEGMHRVYFSVQTVIDCADSLERNVCKDVKLYFDVITDDFVIAVRKDNYQDLQRKLAEKAKSIIIEKLTRQSGKLSQKGEKMKVEKINICGEKIIRVNTIWIDCQEKQHLAIAELTVENDGTCYVSRYDYYDVSACEYKSTEKLDWDRVSIEKTFGVALEKKHSHIDVSYENSSRVDVIELCED